MMNNRTSQTPASKDENWRYGGVIFLDNIGTKAKLGKKASLEDVESFISKYEKILNEWEQPINLKNQQWAKLPSTLQIKLKAFSDTIIITLSISKHEFLLYKDQITPKRILRSTAAFLPLFFTQMFEKEIFLRGAISIGDFYETGKMIVGSALFEAAEYYEQPQWIGISAAPSANLLLSNKSPPIEAAELFVQYPVPLKIGLEPSGWALNWIKVSDLLSEKGKHENTIKERSLEIEKKINEGLKTTDFNHSIKWRNTVKFYEYISGRAFNYI